ncbi:MFS transporter [Candidatus Daviesbacteria bacterium]|nr:MFS transporter [Candidatus Daviesbacteria bacterium]
MVEKVSFTSVLKNRGFLNLWINQILVQLSYNALNFTLIIWVFNLTNSTTAVSGLLLSIYLPAVILGLFSGVLVDLMDRKKIIMMINISLVLCFSSLIFFKDYYILILIVAFLANALGQFYAPAEASAIPLIVKKSQLMTANAIFSATLYSCFLLGFGLAGPLITQFGINFIFIFGTALLSLAFILSSFFPTIFTTPDTQGKKLVSAIIQRDYQSIKNIGLLEILETIRLIRGKLSVLTSIMILAGLQMVIGILATLMPAFLERILQIKAEDASYILIIPLGVGVVFGGLILGKLGQSLIKRVLVSRSILFAGLLFLIMGISPLMSPAIQHFGRPKPLPFFYQVPLSTVFIFGSFLLGLCLVSILVPSQTVLQQNSPKEDRGKVFAVLGVAMAGLSLIPVLMAGILADLFGTIPIFIGLGAIIILIGLFGLKPNLFFKKAELPYNLREFLGLGHWSGK